MAKESGREKSTSGNPKTHELTDDDQALILAQCENQNATSPEQIEGFTNAYAFVRALSADRERILSMTAQDWEAKILEWARTIEPKENANGYRKKPVIFANGNEGTSHKVLSTQMPKFIEMVLMPAIKNPKEAPLDSEQVYKVFETHHPFGDGNGRMGHLLWACLEQRVTGDWPSELPPDVFSEDDLYD